MAGIVKPTRSYEDTRREFNKKRGLPVPTESGIADKPADPPAVIVAAEALDEPRPQAAARKPRQARSNPASQSAPAPQSDADGKGAVLVKLRVPAPKSGAFPLFDQAAASMGEKRALQRLLSKSLSELAEAVERGEKITSARYPIGKVSLNTTKMLGPRLYAAAKAALDPLDLETPGGLGRAISMAALARYLERGGRPSSTQGSGTNAPSRED